MLIAAAAVFVVCYLGYLRKKFKERYTYFSPPDEFRPDLDLLDRHVSVAGDLRDQLDRYFIVRHETITAYKERPYRWNRMVRLEEFLGHVSAVHKRMQLMGVFMVRDLPDFVPIVPIPDQCLDGVKNVLKNNIVFLAVGAEHMSRSANFIYIFTVRVQHDDGKRREYVIRTGGAKDFLSRMQRHAADARKFDKKSFRAGTALAHILMSHPRAVVRVYGISLHVHVSHDVDLFPDSSKFESYVYETYERLLTDIYTDIVSQKNYDDVREYEKRPLLCIRTPVKTKKE